MNPDVVVVGAGPAGMSAALALSAAGAAVRVVDEQPAPGGQVYRAVDRTSDADAESLHVLGADYIRGRALTQQFLNGNLEFCHDTAVWDIYGGDNRAPRVGLIRAGRAQMVTPRQLVLATGAMERPTPFPGWTLPGVMTVGAAQTLYKESGIVPTGRIVVAGGGPLVYLFVHQMLAAGVTPAALLDTGSWSVPVGLWPALIRALGADTPALLKGVGWMREIRRKRIHRLGGIDSLRACGDGCLETVEYSRDGVHHRIEADLLLVHDGVIPNTHLAMAAGCRHHWHAAQAYWAPLVDESGNSSQAGISVAGDASLIYGAEAAVCSGRIVGLDVAHKLGLIDQAECERKTRPERRLLKRIATTRRFLDQHYKPRPWLQVPEDADTLVCRCEEVSVSDIHQVAAIGCMGPNQGKAFTRCGMGPCMGRQCGNTVSQLLAHYHGMDVADVGHYRIRPPVRPITVGQLAELEGCD